MRYGYVKTAAVSPDLKVADVMGNAKKIVEAAEKACEDGVKLLVLPELSICGCTCGDLLFQDTLLKGCEKALGVIADKTADMDMVIIAGLPVKRAGALFNCGAVLYNGDVLGIVPRTYTEGPGEDGGPRYFDPAPIGNDLIDLEFQKDVLFGTDVLFRMEDMSEFCFAVEVGGDICAPIPPSAMHAKAGAAIIANLAASCEAAGKAGKRVCGLGLLGGRGRVAPVHADGAQDKNERDERRQSGAKAGEQASAGEAGGHVAGEAGQGDHDGVGYLRRDVLYVAAARACAGEDGGVGNGRGVVAEDAARQGGGERDHQELGIKGLGNGHHDGDEDAEGAPGRAGREA